MIALPPTPTAGAVTKMVATAGRLKTNAFLLTADHLTLEFDSDASEILGACGEGHVEVRMLAPAHFDVYVAFAQSAVFRPRQRLLILTGWSGSRFQGLAYAPNARGELVLPTNGSFYPTAEVCATPESAEAAPEPIPAGTGPAFMAA